MLSIAVKDPLNFTADHVTLLLKHLYRFLLTIRLKLSGHTYSPNLLSLPLTCLPGLNSCYFFCDQGLKYTFIQLIFIRSSKISFRHKWVAQLGLEHHPVHQRVVGLIPSQGTYLSFQVHPQSGAYRRQPTDVFLSRGCFSFSQINKGILGWGLKIIIISSSTVHPKHLVMTGVGALLYHCDYCIALTG